MDTKKLFDKCHGKLAREGMLKALICGIIIGFGASFVFAFVTSFFTEYFDWWYLISIGIAVGVSVVSAIVLYFAKFRPDTKDIARRLDSLGYDERFITMLERNGDESYYAQRQREDARVSLSKIRPEHIKISIAKSLIIVAIVAGVCGMGMTTTNALIQNEVIPPLEDIVVPPDPALSEVLIVYEVSDDLAGYIEGEAEQYIPDGGNASTVVAVPLDGYAFLEWEEDKLASAERTDTNVIRPESGIIIYTATFMEIGEDDGEDGDLPTDEPSDTPQEEDSDIFDPDSDQKGEGEGEYDGGNAFKDGETPYTKEFDDYYYGSEDGTIPGVADQIQHGQYSDEQSGVANSYFESLKGGLGAANGEDGQ
ncbi:MAG: hypothetical protein IKC48_01705 [Clostridia bacterium]|nr:hypothetical protein [Clostridia bacterium]